MRSLTSGLQNNPGSDLLSHEVAPAVPSAVEGLTAVFGMGTGVTPLLSPPGNQWTDLLSSPICQRTEGASPRTYAGRPADN